ncbi:hypothetical protein CEXT_763651 [Caerostris extrusa]|uniref:Uncharacterized protein n=1 Tax=Caerostris extrusa TaxID=172846 RepID=A0AAV4WA03_CAEEX|nr:hypothetical protein CEXT_763651 [Caerostris extrusa]
MAASNRLQRELQTEAKAFHHRKSYLTFVQLTPRVRRTARASIHGTEDIVIFPLAMAPDHPQQRKSSLG